MTVVINGTTGITNDGGYTGDGIVFADTTPANTLVTTTSGNVGIGTSSPSVNLEVTGGSAPNIKVSSTSNVYTYLTMNAWALDRAQLRAEGASGGGSGSGGGVLSLWTANSSGTMTERARIDSSGNLLVGKSVTTFSTAGTRIYPQGIIEATADGDGPLLLNRTTSDGYISRFCRSGTVVGRIDVTTTATSYVTSSDYRLKDNPQPMVGALEKVAQLKPCTYTWKATGQDGQGFIAHELQAVVPDCVTGEKDAVDADGNPVYQGIDTSFLVATLTAAIQELKAELDAAKADIAALKATA